MRHVGLREPTGLASVNHEWEFRFAKNREGSSSMDTRKRPHLEPTPGGWARFVLQQHITKPRGARLKTYEGHVVGKYIPGGHFEVVNSIQFQEDGSDNLPTVAFRKRPPLIWAPPGSIYLCSREIGVIHNVQNHLWKGIVQHTRFYNTGPSMKAVGVCTGKQRRSRMCQWQKVNPRACHNSLFAHFSSQT